MGNSLGRRRAKVMKIDGETFKLKTPVQVWEVVKDYPDHVLIESGAIKRFGIRAKPLESYQELKPKKLYFLLELPKISEERTLRRFWSGAHMSARDRLESLMLLRRSASDLSAMRPIRTEFVEAERGSRNGAVRVTMRLPKAQVAKLLEESKDAAEAAEKIIDLGMKNSASDANGAVAESKNSMLLHQRKQWEPSLASIREGLKVQKKSVSFCQSSETHLAMASS